MSADKKGRRKSLKIAEEGEVIKGTPDDFASAGSEKREDFLTMKKDEFGTIGRARKKSIAGAC